MSNELCRVLGTLRDDDLVHRCDKNDAFRDDVLEHAAVCGMCGPLIKAAFKRKLSKLPAVQLGFLLEVVSEAAIAAAADAPRRFAALGDDRPFINQRRSDFGNITFPGPYSGT